MDTSPDRSYSSGRKPCHETFPRDTREQRVQLLDGYGESLLCYRLLGYLMHPYTARSPQWPLEKGVAGLQNLL